MNLVFESISQARTSLTESTELLPTHDRQTHEQVRNTKERQREGLKVASKETEENTSLTALERSEWSLDRETISIGTQGKICVQEKSEACYSKYDVHHHLLACCH